VTKEFNQKLANTNIDCNYKIEAIEREKNEKIALIQAEASTKLDSVQR
jgi:hypothetical protein